MSPGRREGLKGENRWFEGLCLQSHRKAKMRDWPSGKNGGSWAERSISKDFRGVMAPFECSPCCVL